MPLSEQDKEAVKRRAGYRCDDHFAWSSDYLRVLPLGDIGGATIARLRMDDRVLVRQRRLLRQAMAAGASPWP